MGGTAEAVAGRGSGRKPRCPQSSQHIPTCPARAAQGTLLALLPLPRWCSSSLPDPLSPHRVTGLLRGSRLAPVTLASQELPVVPSPAH